MVWLCGVLAVGWADNQDFGTCTLLLQDSVGGLEVESPSKPGVFIAAPPVEGAVVFNIGDFLMRWSNGVFASFLSIGLTHDVSRSGL